MEEEKMSEREFIKNRDRDISLYTFEELNTMHRRYDSVFTWHIFSKEELENEIRKRMDG